MLFAALCLSVALPQSTDRISHDSSAGQANSHSYGAQISANGRFVAFQSEASDLVPADTNAAWDIFLRDTVSGMTTRVSVSSFGTQGNHDSTSPAISADGRFITFQSKASNLVAVDSNNRDDIFVHDMKTGLTENVSVSSAGVQSNGVSYAPRISADGRFVVFPCEGNNLVAGDTNGFTDVFRYDRITGVQTLVSKSSFGAIGNDYSTYCDISADGRLVTFRSGASNLVIADANGVYDQFVHDLQTGITTRVSLSSTGIEANGSVHNECAISADGQIVAFASFADNLVSGDSNGKWDVFTHNRSNGATTRVSVHTLGTQGNWDSFFPRLSADGRYVVYQSSADNLVAGDSNGAIDCFLHDRVPDQTFRVSLNQSNGQIAQHCSRPSISANARYITFSSLDGSIVSGDTNGAIDVFLRDRASASAINTILLLGPSQAAVGEIVRFEWFAAPPNSTYYFAYSFVATGSIISGHTFDLVSPTMLGSGLNSNFGGGFYLSNPLPPAAAGLTVYLEVAASTGIGLEDSYPRSLTIY